MTRDQGIAKSGNPRARRTAIELAWLWLRASTGQRARTVKIGRLQRPGDRRGRSSDRPRLVPGLEEMVAGDAEYVTLAGPAQDTLDHPGRQAGLGREADLARDMRGLQARRIVGPTLRQIQCAVDEGMAVAGYVSREHAVWQFVILPAEPVY